ncbi:hypothetical protein COY16_02325 [Candidatus Roizmanbacteria bacterium CG_4_10_14_0_2_um_filter_39_13]|uniref:DNA polymerase III delta N-terminal domain-containing protein n=1 Tax=Candidatus Roizmanbacteria bacterium CG_4_10_14_0_2_um_filter_39_13 TaxID=1974825 RepID=A0A2M7TZZ3_9BACT|nr:MAG: hypothetical protein COY16_02325 [Candidatus Roizmanbacteria bacterium CG_4_10_14_0_2_um_filter_39_13]
MSLPLLVQTHDLLSFHTILENEGIHIGEHNCIIIEPNGQNIRIDQIRDLRKYLVNSGKSSRQIIFYSFHKASIESQNALLKLLEEAGSKFRFALQVESIEQVLSTIRSRCKIMVKSNTDLTAPSLVISISDVVGNNFFNKRMSVTKKDESELFFHELLAVLRTQMKKGEMWTIPVIKKALSLLHLLKQNNLNPQLAVDQCVLLISSVYR